MRKNLFFFICLVFILSCNQSSDKVIQNKKRLSDSIQNTTIINIEEIHKLVFTEPSQRIIISSDKPTQVIGKKGLKITVDTSVLETINGAAIGKQIEIEIKEITNQEELFKNDAPTVSDGKLLISGGAYYIGMTSNGNQLKLKTNKFLIVQIPKTSSKEMELFYGQRDSVGILNWNATGKKIIQQSYKQKPVRPAKDTIFSSLVKKDTTKKESDLERLINYADKKGNRLALREFDSIVNYNRNDEDQADFSRRVVEIKDTVTGKKSIEIQTTYYNPVEINNLGWINCDRFYNNPNKSEIQCEFDSSLNVSLVAIYVIFKNFNAVQKEYVSRLNNSSIGKLYNQYPSGEPVKLIAFTNFKGKFYTSKQELVLKSKEFIKFHFSPVADIETMKQSYKY